MQIDPMENELDYPPRELEEEKDTKPFDEMINVSFDEINLIRQKNDE